MADYQIPPTCNTQKDLPICYRSVQIAPGLSPNGSRDYQQHRPVAYHLHITSYQFQNRTAETPITVQSGAVGD